MRFTRLQWLSWALGLGGLFLSWVQGQVEDKMTEDYVREEVERLLIEKKDEH